MIRIKISTSVAARGLHVGCSEPCLSIAPCTDMYWPWCAVQIRVCRDHQQDGSVYVRWCLCCTYCNLIAEGKHVGVRCSVGAVIREVDIVAQPAE
jgi:hypothetical protein